MKYFSMFSGIGGFEYGISNKGECVGFSEIDKYAVQVYQKHFKEHKNYGRAEGIVWSEVQDFNLLVGGFPCQAFSIAGLRRGFEDTRGTLFFEIARCLREKQPRLFLIENVKGLLSHDKGQTFLTILTTLDELGYDLQWQVLNSKNFGVPQNRERVFIIGHLRGTSRPKVFPIGESQGETKLMDGEISNFSPREFGFKEVAPSVLSRDYKDPKIVKMVENKFGKTIYNPNGISPTMRDNHGDVIRIGGLYDKPYQKHQAGGIYDPQGISPILDTAQGGNREPLIIGGLQKHQTPRNDGNSPCLPEAMGKGGGHTPIIIHNMQTRSKDRPSLTRKCDCGSDKLYKKCCGADGGSGHLSKNDGTTYYLDSTPQAVEKPIALDFYKGNNIRRLTPTECERLQGFPDGWTQGLSDTQRYKTLGNAVTTNVITAIMERLLCNEENKTEDRGTMGESRCDGFPIR